MSTFAIDVVVADAAEDSPVALFDNQKAPTRLARARDAFQVGCNDFAPLVDLVEAPGLA